METSTNLLFLAYADGNGFESMLKLEPIRIVLNPKRLNDDWSASPGRVNWTVIVMAVRAAFKSRLDTQRMIYFEFGDSELTKKSIKLVA